MTDCVFCKIIAGKIPSFKIYDDDNYLAFLDISQFTPGHTLVIPKKHVRYVWDIPNVSDYFKLVSKIANHYRTLGYAFVDSLSFVRMVPHAHVHLLPHNDDIQEYNQALKGLDAMTEDFSRHPSVSKGNELVAKFRLNG